MGCRQKAQSGVFEGDPPFDGRGKMLLVLHRGAGGNWRIAAEMWNAAP